MRLSDIDHSKVGTLEEFIHLLKYGNPELLKTENVSDQSRLLGYLSFLLGSEPVSQQLRDQELFVWPGVEQFFAELFADLHPDLESKANEVFQQGWSFVVGFIGSHNAQHVVRRLLTRLEERFPCFKEAYEQHLLDLVNDFFQPTIGKFLDQNNESIEILSTLFPAIYDLFVSPLATSPSHKNRKLFNFYCNPWIYSPIMNFLAKRDCQNHFSEWPLQWLEERLQAVKLYTNDESWRELVTKSHELLDASDDLEAFANGCSGLLGEIKTAFHLVKNICHPGDILVFLEDGNRTRAKNKKKNCDLMVIRSGSDERILVEVKAKSPRHGVEDAEAGMWDDFVSNFNNSISSYLGYLDCKIAPIFGLSLRQSFPLFSAHEGSGYGAVLPLVYQTIANSQTSDNTPANKCQSVKKIETLLRAFFMKPLVLYPTCVPLPSDDARLSERHQLTESVVRKDWVRNIMQKGVDQLQEACKRQVEEGHQVSKLYLSLDLSLSYRLLQDPFSYNDGNVMVSATRKLEEMFQPFRDELSLNGLDIELLLP
jgi:hypothetical protein